LNRAQHGFSLIELMIAMLLGMILLGGVFQVFVATKNGQRLQNSMAEVQENGRYAIHFLRENILMAGFSSISPIDAFDPTTISDNNLNDQITIRFQSTTDCLGSPLLPAENGIAINRLFVDAETLSLRCDGNGGNDEPALSMVEGIEAMQILYGTDDDEDNVANRYLTATEVTTADAWDNIVSVRIALLARSLNTAGVAENRSYSLLDAPGIDRNDALAHRVFTTTIPIRNRIL